MSQTLLGVSGLPNPGEPLKGSVWGTNVVTWMQVASALVSSTPPFMQTNSVSTTPVNMANGQTYLVNSNITAITLNLPTPALNLFMLVKDTGNNAAVNNITIHRAASEQINGSASDLVISANGVSLLIACDGTNWFTFFSSAIPASISFPQGVTTNALTTSFLSASNINLPTGLTLNALTTSFLSAGNISLPSGLTLNALTATNLSATAFTTATETISKGSTMNALTVSYLQAGRIGMNRTPSSFFDMQGPTAGGDTMLFRDSTNTVQAFWSANLTQGYSDHGTISNHGSVFSAHNDLSYIWVDPTNPRVGIQNSVPTATLDVTGNIKSSTGVTTNSLTVSGLTSGRVPFATTGGQIIDNSALTYDLTTLSAAQVAGTTQVLTPQIQPATDGITLNIFTQSGNPNIAGNILIRTGAGGGTAAGGASVTLVGGGGSFPTGQTTVGEIILQGGAANGPFSLPGGSISIFAGQGGSPGGIRGGNVNVHSGNSTGAGGTAGDIILNTGTGTVANGNVFLQRAGTEVGRFDSTGLVVTGVARSTTGLSSTSLVLTGSEAVSGSVTAGGIMQATVLGACFSTVINSGPITSTQLGVGTQTPQIPGAHILVGAASTEQLRLESTTAGSHPIEQFFQAQVTTTNNTATTLFTWPLVDSTSYTIDSTIMGRRTGGSSGATGDSGVYRVFASVKRNTTSAGIGSLATLQAYVTEDQAGWDANWTISGNNAILQVTGATNNNVTWQAKIRVMGFST